MARNRFWMWAAGCAVGMLATVGASAAEPSAVLAPVVLKHAVVCPPFKGDPAIATVYRDELVKLLKSAEGVEYLEGTRALARRTPEFTYRINGSVVTNEEGHPFVLVTLVDAARKEQIASHIAPASTEPAVVSAWVRTIQADLKRRASKLPFECRVRRRQGQESVSMDRGLGSGLEPGMVLYVSVDEETLISPATGEIIGRDSPRAVGQIQIFRVMEDSSYARPVAGTKLPRFAKLYAKSF